MFKYGIKCSVCGILSSKFAKEEYAERGATKHREAWRLLGEEDHIAVSITKSVTLSSVDKEDL